MAIKATSQTRYGLIYRDLCGLLVGILGAIGCAPQTPTGSADQSDSKATQEAIAQLAQSTAGPAASSHASPGTGVETGLETSAGNGAVQPDQAALAQAVQSIDQIAEGRRYREALRALDRGDTQAVDQIRQELSTSPQYGALAEALQAFLLVRQGRYDDALQIAQRISAIPAMRGEAYVIGGEVFQRQNQLLEAIGAFHGAIQLDPNHLRANRWLGIVYYDIGSMKAATTYLRKVGQLDPQDVNSLLLSGKINQEYEQYQEAIADYEMVVSRPLPENLKLFVQVKLAECLCMLRKLDEARQTLQGCPTTPAVVATRAAIAEAAGQFEEATQLAREALTHSPNQRAATLVLSRIYVTEKQWPSAQELLGPLVKAQPFDHESRLLLGRALIGGGEKEAGQAEVRRATELKNDFLKFADLHQTAMTKPDDAQIRFQLGQMAERLGKTELAISWYAAALGLEPSLKDAETALSRLKGVP